MSQAVTLRYWAAAKAAAGAAEDVLEVGGPTPLGVLRARARALHPGADYARVVGSCSLLVDGLSAGHDDDLLVAPGSTVEFLPPFAGG